MMVGPNYRVGKKIGAGNFGELRLGGCAILCAGVGVSVRVYRVIGGGVLIVAHFSHGCAQS
jgi:hypothetical protein